MYNTRYKLYIKSKTGEDPLVDALIDKLNETDCLNYEAAYKLSLSKTHKSYIEACLLASSDFKRIADIVEIPEEVIVMYAAMFFDMDNADRISKLDMVYTTGGDSSLKLWACSVGLDFIAWRLGKSTNISPIDGLTDLFNTAIYKSKEAIFSNNSETSSIESTKWVKLSIELGKLLKSWVMDSSAARRDLEIALQEVIPEFKSLNELDNY